MIQFIIMPFLIAYVSIPNLYFFDTSPYIFSNKYLKIKLFENCKKRSILNPSLVILISFNNFLALIY